MSGRLLDGASRRSVVGGCVKVLAEILEEVREQDGIDVDWIPRAFNSRYIKLEKDRWEKDYEKVGGGTDLLHAFREAQDEILQDQEIDGNKLVVVFSDGDVCEEEVEGMRVSIAKHGGDVRCMIIGVGSDINGEFSKKIVGENIILAKEAADLILLETIMTMLEE